MKRHIITCLAILCIMLINACVPTFPQSFNTSQLFYPLMNQGSVTSSPSAPAGLPSTFAEFKSRCNSVARSKSNEADYVRVFLISSGSDSRRIVWVKQYQDGLWYVINNADTYMKVREPASSRPDNSHDADYDNR